MGKNSRYMVQVRSYIGILKPKKDLSSVEAWMPGKISLIKEADTHLLRS
jgi:hypothetical protein